LRKFAVLAFLCSAVLFACAVREPPGGGPEDKEPPQVLNTVPASDSAGLDRNISISVLFGEKIDGESFKNRIIFYPKLPFDKIEASDSELKISFRKSLPETTLSLYLQKGYMDYHGVESDQGKVFYYSTADSFEKGSISGTVKFKDEVTEKGIVRIAPLEPDTVGVFKREEKRTVPADRNGNFTFRYLPADSSGLLVWGFIDEKEDGVFSEERELSMLYPDTIYLTEKNRSRRNLLLNIIDPNEPAEVSGEVINKTGYDVQASVYLSNVDLEEKRYYTGTDSLGNYIFRGVKPGAYTFAAFLDISGDSVMGYYADPADTAVVMEEPGAAIPDTLKFDPGEKRKLEPVIIK